MEQVWRKIISVHPAVLYRDDVVELLQLLTQCQENETSAAGITFEYEGLHQSMSSIEEVEKFAKDISTDKLSIDVRAWDQHNHIVNSIWVTMYHSYISYCIASESEAWFLGRIAQLTSFFKERKPWYSVINRSIPLVGPALVMSGFCLTIFSVLSGARPSAAISASFTVLMVIISYLSYRGKLFPYVRIYALNKRKRILTRELISTIIAVLGLIVSIVGLIVIPILQKKP